MTGLGEIAVKNIPDERTDAEHDEAVEAIIALFNAAMLERMAADVVFHEDAVSALLNLYVHHACLLGVTRAESLAYVARAYDLETSR